MAAPMPVYVPGARPLVLPRDEKGRFVTGAGYPQLWGSEPVLTADLYVSGIAAYIGAAFEAERPVTLAGCALAMGTSVQALVNWGDGSRADIAEHDRRRCRNAWTMLNTAREAYLEEILTSRDYATTGVKFALLNQMPERWREAPAPDGASGPAVAVTIQVAGMAERVTVDVAPTGGRTISASALAAEASRIADAGRGAVDADWSEADDDFE